MQFEFIINLCKVMEIQRQEMNSELNQVRPPKKSSPGTSDSSEKGDVCDQPIKKHRRGKHRRKWKPYPPRLSIDERSASLNGSVEENGSQKPRRKWKPYSNLTMEEKAALQARQAKRALKREAQLVYKPSAPWNTTQFLMDDHGSAEIIIPQPKASRSTSMDSSLGDDDLFYESPEDEAFERGFAMSMEKDFEMAYKEVAFERLQDLTKTEIVDQFMNLEQQYGVVKADLGVAHKKMDDLETTNSQLREEIDRLLLNVK